MADPQNLDSVSLGEVYRLLLDVREKMVTKDENNVRLQSITDSISAVRKDMSDMKAETAKVDGRSVQRHEQALGETKRIETEARARDDLDRKELRAELAALRAEVQESREKDEERERQQKQTRTTQIITVCVAVGSIIITTFKGLLGLP